jgi:hypothetical protein
MKTFLTTNSMALKAMAPKEEKITLESFKA